MTKCVLGDVAICHDNRRVPLSAAQRANRKGPYRYYGAQVVIDHIDDYLFDGEYLLIAEDGENLRSQKQDIANLASGKFWVNNHAHIIQTNDACDLRYLKYLLNLTDISGYVTGSAQPKLSQESMMGIRLSLPDISDQRKISAVLSAIEDKIALNRKRIATLEAMAKEIYDYWFVQFDFPDAHGRPYKSSGGAMVYNPDLKREIPKGWKIGILPDIVEFTNGLACQRFRPRSGERSLPVLKIKEMHDGITDQTERVKEDIPERFKVYDGDVVFSWSASLEVMVWFYGNAGLNQHIFKVTEKDGWPIHFSYFLLRDYVETFRRIAEARKTTMGHITSDHLRASMIPLPQHKGVAEKFEEIISPVFDALVKTAQEISKLVNIRDFLLPVLMNGQVKVG